MDRAECSVYGNVQATLLSVYESPPQLVTISNAPGYLPDGSMGRDSHGKRFYCRGLFPGKAMLPPTNKKTNSRFPSSREGRATVRRVFRQRPVQRLPCLRNPDLAFD